MQPPKNCLPTEIRKWKEKKETSLIHTKRLKHQITHSFALTDSPQSTLTYVTKLHIMLALTVQLNSFLFSKQGTFTRNNGECDTRETLGPTKTGLKAALCPAFSSPLLEGEQLPLKPECCSHDKTSTLTSLGEVLWQRDRMEEGTAPTIRYFSFLCLSKN